MSKVQPIVEELHWHDATGDARPEEGLGVIVWIVSPNGRDDWEDWQAGRWDGESWLNNEGVRFPVGEAITHWAEPMVLEYFRICFFIALRRAAFRRSSL